MGDLYHFRFARGAGGEVEDGAVSGLDGGADAFKAAGIFTQGGLAAGAEVVEGGEAIGRAGEQNPLDVEFRAPGRQERFKVLGIFEKDNAGAAVAERFDLVGRQGVGVERRGGRAVGHDGEVGQVELGARLAAERHHLARLHADGAQPAGDFAYRVPVLRPGPGLIAALFAD